jgi:hypothetical protein
VLHFGRIVVAGGGFQYQQGESLSHSPLHDCPLTTRLALHKCTAVVAGDQWPGFYDFNWITSERCASPLFDVQVAPGLEYFAGLQSITIYDYSAADVNMPHYMRGYPALTPESVQVRKPPRWPRSWANFSLL